MKIGVHAPVEGATSIRRTRSFNNMCGVRLTCDNTGRERFRRREIERYLRFAGKIRGKMARSMEKHGVSTSLPTTSSVAIFSSRSFLHIVQTLP